MLTAASEVLNFVCIQNEVNNIWGPLLLGTSETEARAVVPHSFVRKSLEFWKFFHFHGLVIVILVSF